MHVNRFSKGGLLMDCGEGSYGQLRRRFGQEQADALIRDLSCIWISHIHADHHVGLPAILAARTRMLGQDSPPLLVLGPRPLRRALQAYALLEPMRFQWVDVASTAAGAAVPEAVRAAVEGIQAALGLDRFESVPVMHCAHSYGLVLESASEGWKMVFSGDTQPCEQLVEAAKGATLLIHEVKHWWPCIPALPGFAAMSAGRCPLFTLTSRRDLLFFFCRQPLTIAWQQRHRQRSTAPQAAQCQSAPEPAPTARSSRTSASGTPRSRWWMRASRQDLLLHFTAARETWPSVPCAAPSVHW